MSRVAEYRDACAKLLEERGIRGVRCPCGVDLSARGKKTDWCLGCSTPAKRLTRCGVATRPKHTNQAPNGAFTASVAPGSMISG